ncbi:hypothetical protein [Microbacterium sp. SA39]|uniref:hypothetical protein n=1 Tax=Microbacterium sp. SA39 TaxID=1263625 RepID=UPI0005FA2B4C|nr:hypothetical protein [Microbacterium sp. SA39]KJQ52594.1 hypothetical protein RS85_03487 [Microbacterium sp. SA39]
MEIVDGVAAVGEVIGWVGLIVGIPLLLIGLLVRALESSRVRVEITVLEDLEDRPIAVWSTADRTCTRPLSPGEARHLAEMPEPVGYVSVNDAEDMRLEARSPFERACTTISIVMLSAAALGFATSLLPIFWG